MNRAKQLVFETILEDSFRSYEKRIFRYMGESREKYLAFARVITPSLSDPEAVYSRIAFAIVSANAPFEDSVKALNYAIEHKGKCKAKDLRWYKMVPRKAEYLNKLYQVCLADHRQLLRNPEEDWSDYRYRLQKTVLGLGMAKASFAACLLYPLSADLGCVDTWVQKVFLGNTGFKQLSRATYETVEAKIRSYGRRYGVSTFVAQWMLWDFARGNGANNHAIFPGSHKGEMPR